MKRRPVAGALSVFLALGVAAVAATSPAACTFPSIDYGADTSTGTNGITASTADTASSAGGGGDGGSNGVGGFGGTGASVRSA